MRRIVVLFSVLFAAAGMLKAQNYEKVLKTDSTSWISYHRELESSIKDLAFVKSINDTNYLYFAFGIDYSYDPSFVGTLREDDGRLWITYADNPDNEYLLMDMNLEVGDEFVFDEENNITGTVMEVLHENGRKIIVFDRVSYRWFQEPCMFIEGVGRNIMGFQHYDDYDRSYQSCKYENQELVYSTENTHFIDCEMITDGLSDNVDEVNRIEIYPNPVQTSTNVTINTDLDELYCISFYNNNGVLVKTKTTKSKINNIPIDDLNSGMYFIKVFTKKKEIYKTIIIAK